MTSPTFCERCGRKASPDAAFCGGCGRPFPGGGGPADGRADGGVSGGVSGGAERGASSGADDVAEAGPETTVREIRGVFVRTVPEFLLCVLTLGLVWAWLAICRHRLRYRVTTQRIEVVSGLVTVTRRTTELFRVTDLEVVEPFFLRMRGAGHLTVRSQDAADAEFTMVAIPRVHAVHEELRSLVAAERRRNRVRLLEDGA